MLKVMVAIVIVTVHLYFASLSNIGLVIIKVWILTNKNTKRQLHRTSATFCEVLPGVYHHKTWAVLRDFKQLQLLPLYFHICHCITRNGKKNHNCFLCVPVFCFRASLLFLYLTSEGSFLLFSQGCLSR